MVLGTTEVPPSSQVLYSVRLWGLRFRGGYITLPQSRPRSPFHRHFLACTEHTRSLLEMPSEIDGPVAGSPEYPFKHKSCRGWGAIFEVSSEQMRPFRGTAGTVPAMPQTTVFQWRCWRFGRNLEAGPRLPPKPNQLVLPTLDP
jgi:hypothetical protein